MEKRSRMCKVTGMVNNANGAFLEYKESGEMGGSCPSPNNITICQVREDKTIIEE